MEDMAAGRKDLLVGMSKKLVGHTEFAFRDQIKVSRPTPSDVLPSIRLHFPKDSTTCPSSATKWRPKVEAYEPMGDILHSNHRRDSRFF